MATFTRFVFSYFLLVSAFSFTEIFASVTQNHALSSSTSPRRTDPLPPSGHSETHDGDPTLLDIVLLASVDGKLHALSRSSGQILWSMSSFPRPPIPSSIVPLIRTIHNDPDPDFPDDYTNREMYIIEPQTGDIYVMPTPSSPLQPFPFSMARLVEMSPFSFSDRDDHRVFVGRKETSLLLVELNTGKIKATLSSECPWEPFERDAPVDLDDLEGPEERIKEPPTEVFIGRTDYHISIISQRSGILLQNLSYSTYGPNNRDNLLQSAYTRTRDDTYVQSLPNGDVISFKTASPSSTNTQAGFRPIWQQNFGSPIVAVFDIFKNPSTQLGRSHIFTLLQPHPGLKDLVPSLSVDTIHDQLENVKSGVVGIVKESGSLYVMTPSNYPLFAFGETDRSPSIPPGIEGPDNSVPDYDDNAQPPWRHVPRPSNAEPNTCGTSFPPDNSCLVGRRMLMDNGGAQSRIQRLLDGPVPPKSIDRHKNESNTVLVPSPHHSNFSSDDHTLPIGAVWPTNVQRSLNALIVATVFTVLVFGLRIAVQGRKFTAHGSLDVAQIAVPNPSNSISLAPGSQLLSSDELQSSLGENNGILLLEDGDDSEKEGDIEAEPNVSGKRKARRGKRGKKKKLQTADEEKAQAVNGVEAAVQLPDFSIKRSLSNIPSLVVSDVVLGYGSHGTVVYQGSLQGRAVAVKRLLQDFVTLASREVSILQESDDHPNVIRYYYQEARENFLYIALELCPASLADIIETPDKEQFRDIAITFDPKKALRQISSGLRHLHALKLIHRDIKPQNILISSPRNSSSRVGGYRMLISDFGLCKKLDVDQTSFLPTAHGAMAAGTVGWRAPEILRGEVKLDEGLDEQSLSSRGSVGSGGNPNQQSTRLTKAVDIFALGCLFYYTLTNGGHPFGAKFEREVNILKNNYCLDSLNRFGEEGSEAVDLIEQMIRPEPSNRPETMTCLLHPFFWDAGRRLNFLQDASDRFEIMCREPRDPNLVVLEDCATNIVGNDWQARVDKVFLENLGKYRKYDGKSVQDLLRALRNKKHHYQDLPDHVKRHLGPMPEGYLAYFTKRYPRLFLHVHTVIGGTPLRFESMFKSYFELAEAA